MVVLLCSGCVSNMFNLKTSEWMPGHRTGPIVTYYEALDDGVIELYEDAIHYINGAVGCTVFLDPIHLFTVPDNSTQLLCWNLTDDKDRPVGRNLNTIRNGVIDHSSVIIPCSMAFRETQLLVAAHELLHAAGLRHDRELGTIMYKSTTWAGMEMQDIDIKLMRERYCR